MAIRRQKEMICSILLPTRKRVARLKRCLDSLAATADSNSYEVLLDIDDDDEETFAEIAYLKSLPHVKLHFSKRGNGWFGLDARMDRLSAMACGSWLWIMNDDATVEGSGWDRQLEDLTTSTTLVQPEIMKLGGSTYLRPDWTSFPIFPKGCLSRMNSSLESLSPSDKGLWSFLVKQHGWSTYYLSGISVNHQRDSDSDILRHQST